MFRKLWKYEWTAMMRSMFPIYGAVLAVSVLYGLILRNGVIRRLLPIGVLNYAEPIVMMIYAAAIGALVVFSVLMTVQRFYKGLLKQEGYLMFTLPVKVRTLVLSKACVSLVMCVCSVAVAVLSVGCIAGGIFFDMFRGMGELMDDLLRAMRENPEEFTHGALFFGEMAAVCVVSSFGSVYKLYLSMSLGQLSENHKVGCSVLWYVAVNVFRNAVGLVLLNVCGGLFAYGDQMFFHTYGLLHVFGLGLLAVSLAELCVYGFGTVYLLKNRLNLE